MRLRQDVDFYLQHLQRARDLQNHHDEREKNDDPKVMPADIAEEREKFLTEKLKHSELSMSAQLWLAWESLVHQREHPILHSDLPALLELETWNPRDAMLILAGIDPKAAIMDWSYENFMGAEIRTPVIRHANWFTSSGDLYDYPTAVDAEYSSPELRRMIREAERTIPLTDELQRRIYQLRADLEDVEKWEKDDTSRFKVAMLGARAEMVGILKARWDSGEHDSTQRRTPTFFIHWAESRGFEVEWASWAREAGYIDADPPASAPPFFDADAEDYPRLLHISVRAWEHARQGSLGTAKQRISSFLQERYPELSATEKDAIALIGNWQKAGGRPRTGG